ncbi:unnamed protein product [Pseudo-nitzschia multistriata]|uniref:Uncharacterized protein n=1 Tax=Pseudo-nitzschia multistriata TaxID=183589 RepID=A0A448YV52_9STRA|nr:unnamed protein product [Pseudo-nitzschia multistriata]
MRIHSAATSYIDARQLKDDPFRWGPSPMKKGREGKSKSRSFSKMMSAPIRRVGKQLSKRSSRTIINNKKEKYVSDNLRKRDEEQGWIAPASTFETEDSISPRSVGTFETGDSTTLLSQLQQDEEEEERCDSGTMRHLLPNQYLNLKTPIQKHLEAGVISACNSGMVQDDKAPIETFSNENTHDKCNSLQIHDVQVAMICGDNVSSEDIPSPLSTDTNAMLSEDTTSNEPSFNDEMALEEVVVIGGDSMSSEDIPSQMSTDTNATLSEDITSIEPSVNDEKNLEDIENPVSHTVSQPSRSNITLEEDEEIDSMAPAVDFSLYLEEDNTDEELLSLSQVSASKQSCTGILPTEIDIENESDLSTSSDDFVYHQQQYQEDDLISTSSHNSYLRAISDITASASSKTDRVPTKAVDDIQQIEIPYGHEAEVEDYEEYDEDYRVSFSPSSKVDNEGFRVSFHPSNELILQAMEGASLRAKVDIEQATARALSKINTVTSKSRQETGSERSRQRLERSKNRVLGYSFLLLLLYVINGNSLIQSLSSSIGIDDFQIPAKGHSDLTLWVDDKVLHPSVQDSTSEISKKYENAHNVACVSKVGCLALGSI